MELKVWDENKHELKENYSMGGNQWNVNEQLAIGVCYEKDCHGKNNYDYIEYFTAPSGEPLYIKEEGNFKLVTKNEQVKKILDNHNCVSYNSITNPIN